MNSAEYFDPPFAAQVLLTFVVLHTYSVTYRLIYSQWTVPMIIKKKRCSPTRQGTMNRGSLTRRGTVIHGTLTRQGTGKTWFPDASGYRESWYPDASYLDLDQSEQKECLLLL